jgi:lipopolysaccharide export system ATP-binding protein
LAHLKLEKLVKVYGRRRVVDEVDINLYDAEIVGLLGPNGAGKTTSFYMAVGLVRPDQGRIFFNEEDITDLPMYKRARMGISYLPQEASIFRKLTVENNIRAILETMNYSREEEDIILRELLDDLKISHLRRNLGSQLSGGERRRVEITRLLVTKPIFVLLDEPFAGIDPLAVVDLQAIIRHLKERGIGVLISDHNVRETLGVCDRAYILNQGQVLEEGGPDAIVASETARKVYLGEQFRL